MNTGILTNRAAGNDAEALFQEGMKCLKKEKKRDETFKSYVVRKDGLPDEREYVEGMALIEQAAKQGLLKAQSTLGDFYTLGISVKKGTSNSRICKRDEEKGVYWYAEAAKQGDKEAACMLGRIYGLKVVNSDEEPDKEDVDKAVYWYVQAGRYSDAADILDQTGVPDNYDRAVEYYDAAFDNGEIGLIEYFDSINKITAYAHFREQDFYESHIAEAMGEAVRYYESALLRLELAVKQIKGKIDKLKKDGTGQGGNN